MTGQNNPAPAAPVTTPTPTSAPAAPTPEQQQIGTELSPDVIGEFVTMAEEGGWIDRAPDGAGNEDFPDLPPVPDPAPAPAPAPVAPTPASAAPPAAAAVAPPAPVVPQTPPVPAAPEAQPAPVAPAAPGQAPAVAPAPVPAAAPAPAPAAQPLVDPFRLVGEQIVKQEAEFIAALAKQEYTITPEEHEAFISGDTGKLSMLCARIHSNSVKSVMQTISMNLPVFVNLLLKQQRTNEEREQRFWEASPFLDKVKHRDLVPKVLQTYNQLNPDVDEATRFRTVGLLVAQMNGIPAVAHAPQPPAGAPPVTPSALPVRTPGPVVRVVEPPAFAPPSGSSGGPAAPANGPTNPWGDFADFAQAAERGMFDNS